MCMRTAASCTVRLLAFAACAAWRLTRCAGNHHPRTLECLATIGWYQCAQRASSSFLPERPADRRALAHSHVHGGDSELAINGLRQALVGLTNLVDENGNHHDLVPKVAGHLKIVLERTAEREPEGAAHAHPQPSAFLLTVSCLRRPGDEPKFELDTSEMLILKDLTRPQKGRAKRRVWLAAKTALALRAALSSIG